MPEGYMNLSELGGTEKDLENILSINMFEVLFEDDPYLALFQERAMQSEPDIVYVDRQGNLVIFELKRKMADDWALSQILKYTQEVQKWDYEILNKKFCVYKRLTEQTGAELQEFQKDNFDLPSPLDKNDSNKSQKMVIVGHSIDRMLKEAVEYWQRKGVDIDFIPYRVYKLEDHLFFEFFGKPFDYHANPRDIKGVIFDTNRAYDEEAFRYMIENKRISSFGDRADAVYCFLKGDYVFYSHKYVGIVAAGRIKSKQVKENPQQDEKYHDVELLTKTPAYFKKPPTISFSETQEITGRSFFWARINKAPYLTKEESEKLLEEMKKRGM
jgi:hypothetical protein